MFLSWMPFSRREKTFYHLKFLHQGFENKDESQLFCGPLQQASQSKKGDIKLQLTKIVSMEGCMCLRQSSQVYGLLQKIQSRELALAIWVPGCICLICLAKFATKEASGSEDTINSRRVLRQTKLWVNITSTWGMLISELPDGVRVRTICLKKNNLILKNGLHLIDDQQIC